MSGGINQSLGLWNRYRHCVNFSNSANNVWSAPTIRFTYHYGFCRTYYIKWVFENIIFLSKKSIATFWFQILNQYHFFQNQKKRVLSVLTVSKGLHLKGILGPWRKIVADGCFARALWVLEKLVIDRVPQKGPWGIFFW